MRFYILASGSKANCCIIQSCKTTIMIDCGGSKKYLTQALEKLNIDISMLDALLITHTHSDHIGQLKMFDDVPTYAIGKVDCPNFILIDKQQPLIVGDLKIQPISTSHDSDFSCGFIIEDPLEKLVYVTDTGYVSSKNKILIANADYYIFESNHDVELLMETHRPMHIKQRILSDSGHLSNEDSSDILVDVVGTKTKQIILAHLSQEANDESLALETLINKLNNTNYHIEVKIAKQDMIVEGGNND